MFTFGGWRGRETDHRRDRRGAEIAEAMPVPRFARHGSRAAGHHKPVCLRFGLRCPATLDPWGGRRPPPPASRPFPAIFAPLRSLRLVVSALSATSTLTDQFRLGSLD